MRGLFGSSRRWKLTVVLLLLSGLALAGLSITQVGAKKCLHCFLAKQWPEATLSETRSNHQDELRTESFSGAQLITASDPPHLWNQIHSNETQLVLLKVSSCEDSPTAVAPEWFFDTSQEAVAVCSETYSERFAAPVSPKILGLRAPPFLIGT